VPYEESSLRSRRKAEGQDTGRDKVDEQGRVAAGCPVTLNAEPTQTQGRADGRPCSMARPMGLSHDPRSDDDTSISAPVLESLVRGVGWG
jgi:hypothetical protein